MIDLSSTDQTTGIDNTSGGDSNVSAEDLLMIQEMAELGMFFGLSKGKTHPRMRPFIHSTRSGNEMIDLEQTAQSLKLSVDFLKKVSESGKQILLVGTTPAGKSALFEAAGKLNQPYVVKRWLGGTLTNFKVIMGRIEAFKKLLNDRESGNLAKYTKKERLIIDRQLEKMENLFGGLRNFKELPGAIFIIDPVKHKTAIREARRAKIPIIAVINTNVDPTLIDYPIPANDRNPQSIRWILNYLTTNLIKIKSEN